MFIFIENNLHCIFIFFIFAFVKRILNNSKEYYKGLTKSSFLVETSESPMFKMRMSDYWNTRIYSEYIDCINHGGRVIFANPTYDDRHLPRYWYFSQDGTRKWFPTFSKRDKDRFLSSLLKRWERAGFTGNNTSYPFKYIWANEYGTEEGYTHRPHYHIMLFIPIEIYEYESKRCFELGIKCTIENYWKNLLQHYWSVQGVPLGMVRWSPDESIFVNAEFACMYCSKYMFKSDNLLINEKVKEYYDEFGKLPDDGKKKGSLTTHWQSLHFGESLKKKFDDPDIYSFGLNLNMPSEIKTGKVIRHPIPPYIDNKVAKQFDPDKKSYRVSERGRFLRFSKFLKTYDKNVNKFSLTDDVIDSVVPDIITDPRSPLACFKTKEELKKFVHNADSRKFLEKVYLYRKVWDGLLVEPSVLDKLKSCSWEDFKEFSFNTYYNSIAPHLDGVPCCTCETGIFKNSYIKLTITEDVLGIPCASPVDVYPCEDSGIFYECMQYLDIFDEIRRFKLLKSEEYYNKLCEEHRKFKRHLRNRLIVKSA